MKMYMCICDIYIYVIMGDVGNSQGLVKSFNNAKIFPDENSHNLNRAWLSVGPFDRGMSQRTGE